MVNNNDEKPPQNNQDDHESSNKSAHTSTAMPSATNSAQIQVYEANTASIVPPIKPHELHVHGWDDMARDLIQETERRIVAEIELRDLHKLREEKRDESYAHHKVLLSKQERLIIVSLLLLSATLLGITVCFAWPFLIMGHSLHEMKTDKTLNIPVTLWHWQSAFWACVFSLMPIIYPKVLLIKLEKWWLTVEPHYLSWIFVIVAALIHVAAGVIILWVLWDPKGAAVSGVVLFGTVIENICHACKQIKLNHQSDDSISCLDSAIGRSDQEDDEHINQAITLFLKELLSKNVSASSLAPSSPTSNSAHATPPTANTDSPSSGT